MIPAIPLPVYLALCILALCAGVAIVLLFLIILERNPTIPRDETYSDDDPESPDEIPEYPPPASRVTRWGMHRDHIRRGFETEAGCPVCYEFRLHTD